ncbi:MAG: hypothetical protein U5K70_07850 [Halodesulfurarchaeum sp.]|nr:hypothetical protein [Halodesulfurarchaeum sp.]
MSTAVRMDEETKSRLEELQALIKLETGKKVTQQEILERLVDDAYESRDAIIESFETSTVPLSKAEISRMQAGRIESGVETTEDDIDEILYG